MSKQTKAKTASPYLSIVIPAYNEEDHIGLCLQSIFNSDCDSSHYEVIVVDNGSQDHSYEIAISFERANVFRLPYGNVGAVRNHGAKKASGRILVFIDADCLMDSDWINRAIQLIKDRSGCAYGGGAKLPDKATWIETAWLLQKKGQATLPKHLIGASIIISKEIFMNIGGFDERVSSGEDTELHNRLISRNIPVLIDNALDVVHLGNAKTPIQFIRRQAWHAENYLVNFTQSLRDPMFLITLVFFALPFFAVTILFFSSTQNIIFNILVMWGIIPLLLSCKRLSRAKYIPLNPIDLLKIYFLDYLYLTGRCLGLLKGFFNLAK